MNKDENNPTEAKILIVDDQPSNLDILVGTLEPQGSYVIIYVSTKSYLHLPERLPWESPLALILIDILMPEMDGYQVCQRLKQEPSTRDIPVIFVTAKDETEDVVQGFIGINLRNFSFNLRVTNALN